MLLNGFIMQLDHEMLEIDISQTREEKTND